MAQNGDALATDDGPKRYLLDCDDCSFERTVEGREEVERIGDDHRSETGHELLAVEAPEPIGRPLS